MSSISNSNNNQETRVRRGFFNSITQSLHLKGLINQVFDLVFPPACLNCGRVDYYLCDRCQHDLQQLPIEIIEPTIDVSIPIIATGYHDSLLQAGVQALKYHQQRQIGSIFAQRLYNTLNQLNWTFDIVIPVPLHTTRLANRGYNQAKEVSQPLADLYECSHDTTSIVRHRNTQSQVTLSRQERKRNLEGAFTVKSNLFQGKSVLLVDDVTTTGATLDACAQALQSAGADTVFGISVTAARFQT